MNYTVNLISSKNLFFIFAICIFLSCFIPIDKVTAQELKLESIPYQDISTGSLYFKSNNGYFAALTQNSNYQVNVNGLLARVNFTQTFKSDGFSDIGRKELVWAKNGSAWRIIKETWIPHKKTT